MSTLEAVAAAVTKLEGAAVAEPLERLYDEVVRRTIAFRWGVKPSRSCQVGSSVATNQSGLSNALIRY